MDLPEKIEAYMQRKVDFTLEVVLRAGFNNIPYIDIWNITEKPQPTQAELDAITLPLRILADELTIILNDIRNIHLIYLSNLQKQLFHIGQYYFPLSDEFYNSIKNDIENAQGLGFTTVFSRDGNNNYFMISISEAETLLNQLETGRLKLWITQKLSYFKKWTSEIPFKQCTSIEQLDTLSKDFTINVTTEEVNTLYNMTPTERDQYMQQVASNFIQN